MIGTITLNPAMDKTARIATLETGEVNRLLSVTNVPGGKGINVAKILRQFHLPVASYGFLGGFIGKEIADYLEEIQVNNHMISIQAPTRCNTNILGADGCVTEILEPGPEITKEEQLLFWKNLTNTLDSLEALVISGSLPKGVDGSIYAQILLLASSLGIKTFLDTSGEALSLALDAKPYFVKPNKKELEAYCGRALDTFADIEREAKALLGKGISVVVVSLGAEGLAYFDENNSLFLPAKEVKAVNTVACGDTVVASFVMSTLAKEDPKTALEKACALAAANATTAISAQIPMDTYFSLLSTTE